MAEQNDPFSLNILGVSDLVKNKTNKVNNGAAQTSEGEVSEKYDVLSLDMTDDELLTLRTEWESAYAPYETKIKRLFTRNAESYLGKRANGEWLAGDDNIAANLQFEAEETFIAATLSKDPDPVVFADNSDEGNKISTDVRTMLQFHADQQSLRRKLSFMVRQWSIYQLGVLKHGWNPKINDITTENRKIENFIFDPNGYVDAYGDFSSYLGERIEVTAETLIKLFPKHKEYIQASVDNKLGTKVIYTEWWTDEYCFTTYKEKVLDKHKNEYFKYEEPATDELGIPMMDESGEQIMLPNRNHFASPKKPYTFLSVFSLQNQPHDNTGLIEQNIPNQKLIVKRTEQIDYNVSTANNSVAYSEDNFNQETAKQASTARRKGNPILVPSGGPISNAIMPLDAQSLPADVFNSLEISKNDLRTSWGINGLTSQPPDEDQTARGMILDQQNDTTRIGGGIGDAIEQVAKNVYNWWVQLYFVFYDEQHFGAVMGNAKATEYVVISGQNIDRQLIVSVSPNSMRPKDQITELNLAQALFDKGAIGPKTLLKMVDFPNADDAAADGVLFRMDPMAYFQLNFPEYAARLQQQQQVNAMTQIQNTAMQTGANTAAQVANTPPEATTEPPQPMKNPASAALSQIPINLKL